MRSRPRSTYRPELCALEDRCLPSALGRGHHPPAAALSGAAHPGLLGDPPAANAQAGQARRGGRDVAASVLPPQSHPHGASYGQWAARWWQWAFSLPEDSHPLFDTAPAGTGQTGHVWFLGGSFTSAAAVRNVTVPAGTALFFPVVNYEADNIFYDPAHTEQELRAEARVVIDSATDLFATVDGVAIGNLKAQRVQSPLFQFTVTEGGLYTDFGVPAGTTSAAVTDGYYVMLQPLPVGEHTLTFGGSLPALGFSTSTTYHITVTPGR